MNRRLKEVLVTGLMVLGIGAIVQRAEADTMTVSVTPIVNWSVSISSPETGGYDFSSVALGATTVSTLGITLTNNSGVAPEYFTFAIGNTSGNWSPAPGGAGVDQFRMGAYINATQPAPATFVDFLSNPPFSGSAVGKFGQAGKTAIAGTAKAWLRLEMPTSLSVGTSVAQTMTLTVSAQGT